MLRINDEIVRVASDVIRNEMADPRIGTVVSVIKAETTTDLKYCKISVSVFGDDKQKKDTMDALKNASGFVRKRIAEIINLRLTPEITFIFDDSIEYGMRMKKLIEDVNKPLGGRGEDGSDK
jgi:ribosome-binding factor A